MIYNLPDGTIIESKWSGFPNGPNQTNGQRFGTSYLWLKVNNSEWRPSGHRNEMNLKNWIEICDNLKDFLDTEH